MNDTDIFRVLPIPEKPQQEVSEVSLRLFITPVQVYHPLELRIPL